MKYKAVFFDLDGTLVPMDNDEFTKGYFTELTKKISPLGIAPDDLVSAIWAGTKAMVKNDGSKKNVDVFWETFSAVTGKEISLFKEPCDEFYVKEFAEARKYTAENPDAVKAVELAKKSGAKVVLASNPVFPLDGQLMRMSWVGLKKDDFDYITSYESESFCKPNPEYYRAVCEKLGVLPSECLHIGNDEGEDMKAAGSIGIDCYLITDCIIKREGIEYNGKKGSFGELLSFLETI